MGAEAAAAEVTAHPMNPAGEAALPEQFDPGTFEAVSAHTGSVQELYAQHGANLGEVCPFIGSLGVQGAELAKKWATAENDPDRGPSMAELLAARRKQVADQPDKPAARAAEPVIKTPRPAKQIEIAAASKTISEPKPRELATLAAEHAAMTAETEIVPSNQTRNLVPLEIIMAEASRATVTPAEVLPIERKSEAVTKALPVPVPALRAIHTAPQVNPILPERQSTPVSEIDTEVSAELPSTPGTVTTEVTEPGLLRSRPIRPAPKTRSALIITPPKVPKPSSKLTPMPPEFDVTAIPAVANSYETPTDFEEAEPTADFDLEPDSLLDMDGEPVSFEPAMAVTPELWSEAPDRLEPAIFSQDQPAPLEADTFQAEPEPAGLIDQLEADQIQAALQAVIVEALRDDSELLDLAKETETALPPAELERLCTRLIESLALDSADETVRTLVLGIIAAELPHLITPDNQLTIEQLNLRGTHEYKTASGGGQLSRLAQLAKRNLLPHARLGSYTLAASGI